MSAYSDVRTSLKDALVEAGFSAFTVIPERVTPPFVYVAPADPYITREGATFGGEILHHYVGVVAGRGVNEKLADDLDDQLVRVLDAIDATDDHHVREVEQPGQITISGQQHLAVAIVVDTEIHRG